MPMGKVPQPTPTADYNPSVCTAAGDSLTLGNLTKVGATGSTYEQWLQEYEPIKCSSVVNLGVAGESSTEVAVRIGAYNGVQLSAGAYIQTLSVEGGIIPAAGSVKVTFPNSIYDPAYSASGRSVYPVPVIICMTAANPSRIMGTEQVGAKCSGITGDITYGSGYTFTRSVAGTPATVLAGMPYWVDTRGTVEGFVSILVGKNNISRKDGLAQVEQDLLYMSYVLPVDPTTGNKRFVIATLPTSNIAGQWTTGPQYHFYKELKSFISEKFPKNSIDLWRDLVAAYDPTNPEDVIDEQHNTIPSHLRLTDTGHLTGVDYPDTVSCPVPRNSSPNGLFGQGTTVYVDAEKIYYISTSSPVHCIRGYAGTVPAIHALGARVQVEDATHFNMAGQQVWARAVANFMDAGGDPGPPDAPATVKEFHAATSSPATIGGFAPADAMFAHTYLGAALGLNTIPMNVGSLTILNPGSGYTSTPAITCTTGYFGIPPSASFSGLVNGTPVGLKLVQPGTPSTVAPQCDVATAPSGGVTTTLMVTPQSPATQDSGLHWHSSQFVNGGDTYFGGSAAECIYFAGNAGQHPAGVCPTAEGNGIAITPGPAYPGSSSVQPNGGFLYRNGWSEIWFNAENSYAFRISATTDALPRMNVNAPVQATQIINSSASPTAFAADPRSAKGLHLTASGSAQAWVLSIKVDGTMTTNSTISTFKWNKTLSAAYTMCQVQPNSQPTINLKLPWGDFYIDALTVTGGHVNIGGTPLPPGGWTFSVLCL